MLAAREQLTLAIEKKAADFRKEDKPVIDLEGNHQMALLAGAELSR
jgi:hypothetical protein